MKKFRICIYLTVVIITICQNLFAAKSKDIYIIDLKKDIGSTAWLYIQKGFEIAKNRKSDLIIIHMNTYGGELVYADSIRTQILNSKIPVYVFVDNNAASAGALIAISCDKIFMRKGASIGAATVVNQSGEKMPDKYQSYMRATMRSTAESHGKDTIVTGKDTTYRWKRNPLIAEAMVDERTVIPGVIDTGKILTFTAQEAIKNNYCEGIAENISQLVEQNLGISDYEITEFKPSTWDDIKGLLMSSAIQGILIMLIIGGIYFELQTPGIVFPIIIAVSAAVLYFAPLYIDGLAANWEILLFLIGLVLIALELFVIPGFGIAGISGITLVIAGLTLSLLNNVDFNFDTVETNKISRALLTVISGVALSFALIIYISSKIGTKGIFKKMALNATLSNSDGYVGVEIQNKSLINQTGIAYSDLRPSGKVKVNNSVYDAISTDGYIERGTLVKIIRFETGQLYVEKTEGKH